MLKAEKYHPIFFEWTHFKTKLDDCNYALALVVTLIQQVVLENDIEFETKMKDEITTYEAYFFQKGHADE